MNIKTLRSIRAQYSEEKAKTMKKVLLIAAFLIAAPIMTLADNVTSAAKDSAAISTKAAAKKSSKPVRLSDAQLDKISAGTAEHTTGGGLTIINNPGNADVFNLNKHGHLLCVNC